MSDVKLTNIPCLNVGWVVEKLAQAYSAVIKNRLPIKTMPSVMLWGPPGVGKSQAIRQIARDIEASTGKTVKVTDVRLLLFNPIVHIQRNRDVCFSVLCNPFCFSHSCPLIPVYAGTDDLRQHKCLSI